jgi:hypothetical protein
MVNRPSDTETDTETDTDTDIKMTLIQENTSALLWQIPSGEFEIWIRLKSMAVIEPKDSDFGVWAWSVYTRKRADLIFGEITTGKRTINPMSEATDP